MALDAAELSGRLQGTWRPNATKSSQVTITLMPSHEFRMTIHALSTGEKLLQQLRGNQATGTWDIQGRRRPVTGVKAALRSSSQRASSIQPRLPHITEDQTDAP